jgi:phosphatidylglycerophosphate synthase
MDKPPEQLLPLSINIPNILTGIRILLTGATAVLLLSLQTAEVWIAAIVLLLASFTDKLDGFLARKLGQVTLSGALFDLITDLVMMSTILVLSVIKGYFERTSGLIPFNPFPFLGLVLAIQLTLLVGVFIFIFKRRTRPLNFPAPTLVGKISSMILMLTIFVAILSIGPAELLATLMYLTIILILIGAYSYLRKGSYIFTQ